jgi:hypothetical protein
VSNVKDAWNAITGVNPVTGEKLGVGERILSGIFAIPGLGNVAKYIGKGGKLLFKGIGKLLGKGFGKWLGRAGGKLASWAGKGWRLAKPWLKKGLGWGKKLLDKGWNALKRGRQWASRQWNQIKGGAKKFSGWVKGKWQGLTGTLRKGLNWTQGIFKGALERIQRAPRSLAGKAQALKNTASRWLKGLWERYAPSSFKKSASGMRDKWQGLKRNIEDKLKGWKNSARNWIKEKVGKVRTLARKPRGAVHNASGTNKRHTIGSSTVIRDLQKGKEAHVFDESVDLKMLEEKVWSEGKYGGEVRGWRRYFYESPSPIGRRVQNGKKDVPLHVVEIKLQKHNGKWEYHLVPRTKAAQ